MTSPPPRALGLLSDQFGTVRLAGGASGGPRAAGLPLGAFSIPRLGVQLADV